MMEESWVDISYKVGDGDSEGNYIEIATGEDGYGVKLTNGGKEDNYFGKADISMSKGMAKKLGEMLIKLSSEVQ